MLSQNINILTQNIKYSQNEKISYLNQFYLQIF